MTARHVVTAAHCMREDLVTVLLGEHVLHNDTDGARPEEFSVIRKTPHENYNSRYIDSLIVYAGTEVTGQFANFWYNG